MTTAGADVQRERAPTAEQMLERMHVSASQIGDVHIVADRRAVGRGVISAVNL